jgi:hypothetical protein
MTATSPSGRTWRVADRHDGVRIRQRIVGQDQPPEPRGVRNLGLCQVQHRREGVRGDDLVSGVDEVAGQPAAADPVRAATTTRGPKVLDLRRPAAHPCMNPAGMGAFHEQAFR